MTGKERMLKTLNFEEPDRPPHFEIMFELEKEAFGLEFPKMAEWDNCTALQKDKMITRCINIYEKIVDRYQWDALLVFYPWSDPDGIIAAKKAFGNDLLIGGIVGGTIWSIEGITDWTDFSVMLMENPDEMRRTSNEKTRIAIEKMKRLIDAGTDFIHLVNDVAFNAGPFIAPEQFSEFITPQLKKQVDFINSQNTIPFVHTDGNIDPILDDYLSLGAACFQSVDPMAGMDIAETKRRCYGKMALMGNVQCNLLQDGPNEAIRKSALYCLENCTSGGGYIFGTSNTIFKGMPLENYEYMVEVYRDFCNNIKKRKKNSS
jgi:uroporphyrinogen-III decarboxylase